MSDDRLPKAEVETDAVHIIVEQDAIGPHMAEFSGIGSVRMLHADGINVGKIEVNDGAPRIALTAVKAGCPCGCKASGLGLLVTPGPDEARAIARTLIAQADAMEAAAAAQAGAAINKARGR